VVLADWGTDEMAFDEGETVMLRLVGLTEPVWVTVEVSVVVVVVVEVYVITFYQYALQRILPSGQR